MGNDLSKQLGEVGYVGSEKAGLEHQSLSGVVRDQLTSEKFSFPDDADGGSGLRGVL
jgi:hypothetical protein